MPRGQGTKRRSGHAVVLRRFKAFEIAQSSATTPREEDCKNRKESPGKSWRV
jgi:hypothetical protein